MSNQNLTEFFKGVKNNYPKSYKRFQQWLSRCHDEGKYMKPVIDSAINFDMYIYLNFRDLYDFFDDADIVMDVMYSTDDVADAGFTMTWFYSIADVAPDNEDLDMFYVTRKQAETAAFMRGFQILEAKI